MLTIFRYSLARMRGQVLGWGLAMCAFAVLSVARYGVLRDNQESVMKMLGSMKEVAAVFGDTSKLFTPEGFLSMQLFNYLPLILGVYAVLVGSGLLASDEENGTLDLVLAHPISRTALFAGRWLALVVSTGAILVFCWLGLVVGITCFPYLDLGWAALLLPNLSLLAVLLLYGCLALLLGTLLPSRRAAAMTAGLVMVASFFLTMFGRVDDGVKSVAQFFPLEYYQSGEAILGLNGAWLGGLLAGAGALTVLAWWRFERRDIRVVGEGTWPWPRWARRTRGVAASGGR
jgi:ABC-2 type transport system permease protein